MKVAGLVLAAGRSSRFGSEKAMALLEGRPLLDHAIAYLRGGCDAVAINAPPQSLAAKHASGHGLTVISDRPSDPKGPLAGLKAGLQWAKGLGADLLLLTPCDTPRVPGEVAVALIAGKQTAAVRTDTGLQPLHSVWTVEPALDGLTACFRSGRHPAVRELLSNLNAVEFYYPDDQAFSNVNSSDDLGLLGPASTASTFTRNL